MSEMNSNFENEIKQLQSDDPSEKRIAVEDLMNSELDENIVALLCKQLEDSDKGVRDSTSMTLIFNGHSSIPKHVIPYISSPEISVRNLAGEIILRIGENCLDDVIVYLDNCNDDDQKFLIDVVGLIGSEKPVAKILEILNKTTNDNVVLACIEAIGNIGYSDALPVLINLYEKNELYKPTIIEALGKMNSREILDFITSKFAVEDELTKFSIIESLGNLGDESTFYFLLTELSKTKGPLIWPIIASLQMLKEKLGLDLPFDESIKNSILFTLLEAEPKYKRAAANLVTVFDDKDILDALLRIYGEDPETDENIKPAFFQYSNLIYPKVSGIIKQFPKNLKNLLWLIKEIVEFDGGESINALSQLDRRSLCDAYTMCLDNPDEEVRKTSIELLFLTSVDTALVFIDTMIEDDNMWNRLKILELMENIYQPKVNEILKKLFNDPEEMIKERVEWMLAQRGITNLEINNQ
jgi:HEAT repeat protein